MKQSKNAAFGGVFTALSVAFLYLSVISPVSKLGFCAIAGIFPAVSLSSGQSRNAFLIYAATSILSMILLPVKSFALIYILFFGLYPFAKYVIESKAHRFLQWLIKMLFCNLLLLLYAKLTLILFSINLFDSNNFVGQSTWCLVFLAINITFILYDIVFSKVTFFLTKRIRL